MIYLDTESLGAMMEPSEQSAILEQLKEKYAPGAIPKAQSQTEPLELHISLNSEAAAPPTSELDQTLSAPPSPASPIINILPVKRKPVSTHPSTLSTNSMIIE
jgi:hypothetical protein